MTVPQSILPANTSEPSDVPAGASDLLEVRDVSQLVVPRIGEVVAHRDDLPYRLQFGPGSEFWAPNLFLAQVFASYTAATVRSYAYSLLRLLRFLLAIGVPPLEASRQDITDFVRWMKVTENYQRRRGPATRMGAPGALNTLTGKQYPGACYAPGTINHCLAVAGAFFGWARSRGLLASAVNPVPRRGALGDGRYYTHHNPMDPYLLGPRAALRQKMPQSTPRRMRTEHLNAFFSGFRYARDRAILHALAWTGARIGEVLSLTKEHLDPQRGVIHVLGKGTAGRRQEVPAPYEFFVYVALAEQELLALRGKTLANDEPLFWVLHEQPLRPVTYDTVRSPWRTVNARLGTNYTFHDLRHTAAYRMLDGGLSLTDVQTVLRHAQLATTSRYLGATPDELVAKFQAAYASSQTERSTDEDWTEFDLDPEVMETLFPGLGAS